MGNIAAILKVESECDSSSIMLNASDIREMRIFLQHIEREIKAKSVEKKE